jgi:class 3 adenylate cyclase
VVSGAPCTSCRAENPPMAMFCMYCGGALAREETPARLRPVTVVFCDIAGSTQLAQRFDPQVWHGILDAYFTAVGAALTAVGGRLEKFIGDAVVAVFGADSAGEDDAVRAVRGVFDAVDGIAAQNRTWEGRYGLRLSVRFGLASGRVVTTGRDSSFAVGTVMNRAARLQGAAPVDGAVIDVRTWLLVRDRIGCRPVEPVPAKGFDRPLRAWSVSRAAADGHRGPFVNQTALLRRLSETARAAVGGNGVTVLRLAGEPGSGKSRVLDRLARDLHRHDVRVARITCAPSDADHPLLGLEQARAALIGDHGRRRAGGPIASTRELAWRLSRELAAAAPLALLVDDFPHASPVLSAALLDAAHGTGGADQAPGIALVLAGRSVDEPADASFTVPPLGDAEARELLECVTGDLVLHAAVATEPLVRRGGGNPLFLEQLAMLASAGITDEVAPSAEAALGVRIESLPASARYVLACLGAADHAVAAGELEAVCDLAEDDLQRALDELHTAGLLGDPVAADVAHAQMVLGDRARVHVAVAELLRARANDEPALLDLAVTHAVRGHRYWQEFEPGAPEAAVARQLAARSLVAAARQAIARSEVRRASELCERARPLVDGDDALAQERAALHAYALGASGRPAEALALVEDGTRRPGNASATCHLLVTGTVLSDLEPPELRALVHEVDDPTAVARLETWDGLRAARAGDYPLAEGLLESAHSRMRPYGNGLGSAEIYGNLSLFLLYGDTPVRAALSRCLALRDEVADAPILQAVVSCAAAVLRHLAGEPVPAAAMLHEARTVFEEMGHERGLAGALEFSSVLAELAGDCAEAAGFLRQAASAHRATGADRAAVLCAARAHLLDGRGRPARLPTGGAGWEARVLEHQFAALGALSAASSVDEVGAHLDAAFEEIARVRGAGARLMPLLGSARIARAAGDDARVAQLAAAVTAAERRGAGRGVGEADQ